jgi:pyruvate kinase
MIERARKRTKIVATLGPSTRDRAILRNLIEAGTDVVRLNFSHGTHAEHGRALADVRAVAADLGRHVAVLQDLPGPKVRTGTLAPGLDVVGLRPGDPFTLTTRDVEGSPAAVSVSYAGLPADVTVGKRLYLADGAIALRIVRTAADDIETRVEAGGALRARQGINYPDGTLRLDAVTESDLSHVAFGLAIGVDMIAVSFVKSAEDVLRVKRFVAERGMTTPVIAKIEKHEALECIDEIVAVADGIMVARGDLGIEIPLERVPLVQKDLIARANRASKPVVTATQMLQSMISSATPTRAEATDVANAIIDGTDAVMLSGETAMGAYPVEAVATMARIAREVESAYPHADLAERRIKGVALTTETSIAEAAAHLSEVLGLGLIITGTAGGNTARHVSSFRPHARIAAMTSNDAVARRAAILWGVDPYVVATYSTFEELIDIAQQHALAEGLASPGDTVAITSGMPVGAGGTNVLKLHRLPA